MTTDQPDRVRRWGAPSIDPLIHQAFAAIVAVDPQRTALVFRGEQISYHTVNAAADAYAARLAVAGVTVGTTVPVRLARSPQLVAVLLAVLKCGAAYAAFDVRWPQERVELLVRRMGSPLFVTDEPYGAGDCSIWTPPAGTLAEAALLDGVPPRPVLAPDAAACVFFTSGTTGEPKGVLSPHQATTRLFGADRLPGFGPRTVTPQAAPSAWDAFSLELWGALTTGGTTVIVEDDYLLPGALRDLVTDHGVTTAFFTTSLFNLFVDMDIDCFAGMSCVYVGGERLSPSHVRRFVAQHPDIALSNAYGPVESCVFCSVYPISLADCETTGGIPIGYAVPDTDLYVVGDDMVVRDSGELGEICVGGTGLAIGYLGQPELTAEKFVDITVNGKVTRVYRTGDLGFMDVDGVAQFRGRADRQVKIRGYRIELSEIENRTAEISEVGRCAAVPVPGQSQMYERIALFYTMTSGLPVTDEDPLDVYKALSERLPEYLVPDIIRGVQRLPMTANGKVDAAALLESLTS